MFREISAKEISGNLIKAISEEYMLITAGKESDYNMMTASWGFMGEMWGSDCAAAVVRPQRYTMNYLNAEDTFTLSFYGDSGKAIHKICGSKSGRDTDKTAETGLTPIFDGESVYFEQARLVLVCRKQYVQPMGKEFFTDSEPLRWYSAEDYHYMIIGKIERVLVKE